MSYSRRRPIGQVFSVRKGKGFYRIFSLGIFRYFADKCPFKSLVLNKVNDSPWQNRLTRFLERVMKNPVWALLIVLALAIRWAALYPEWVEQYYSKGFFPIFSEWQRRLLGWVPLSVGDLFYGFLVLLVLLKTYALLRDLYRKRVDRAYWVNGARQFIFLFLVIYVFFNLLWGLNYSRSGIGQQLQLFPDSVSVNELDGLSQALLAKASANRNLLLAEERLRRIKKRSLFSSSMQVYLLGDRPYALASHASISIKPSLYSYLGNYLGFQGYYNPFSGEAQVNTTIPVVLQPFVTLHELAHQAGYAKESEANFVGYLSGKDHPDPLFRYSIYLELFRYAQSALYRQDSTKAKDLYKRVPDAIKSDLQEIRRFYLAYQTPVERIIMKGYDYFLRANDQPQGTRSYSQVVGWVVAYVRKEGMQAL
jgi:Protein of unknown function (DUF3810)